MAYLIEGIPFDDPGDVGLSKHRKDIAEPADVMDLQKSVDEVISVMADLRMLDSRIFYSRSIEEGEVLLASEPPRDPNVYDVSRYAGVVINRTQKNSYDMKKGLILTSEYIIGLSHRTISCHFDANEMDDGSGFLSHPLMPPMIYQTMAGEQKIFRGEQRPLLEMPQKMKPRKQTATAMRFGKVIIGDLLSELKAFSSVDEVARYPYETL